MYEPYLYHHGVKGQKWGVRRYQYADGALTPAGRKRYSSDSNSLGSTAAKDLIGNVATRVTGKQYVDTYLAKDTTFARIQTSDVFEQRAFYATYKKRDMDKYLGLFGKNLSTRAAYAAKKAEKEANESGSEADLAKAKELRTKSDNIKIYQLKMTATKN